MGLGLFVVGFHSIPKQEMENQLLGSSAVVVAVVVVVVMTDRCCEGGPVGDFPQEKPYPIGKLILNVRILEREL